MELHKNFLVQAKKGHIDLLFLGDSITQGWNENTVWQGSTGLGTRPISASAAIGPSTSCGEFRTESSMVSNPK